MTVDILTTTGLAYVLEREDFSPKAFVCETGKLFPTVAKNSTLLGYGTPVNPLRVHISSDLNNTLGIGSDGGLYSTGGSGGPVLSVNGYIGHVVLTKANIGLSNVENTALSTWIGSTNITTLGTITTGTWHGTSITDTYISSAATWNAKQPALTGSISGTINKVSVTPNVNSVAVNTTITIPSNAELSIAKITNLTSNGVVTTSGGDGTLGISAFSYLTNPLPNDVYLNWLSASAVTIPVLKLSATDNTTLNAPTGKDFQFLVNNSTPYGSFGGSSDVIKLGLNAGNVVGAGSTVIGTNSVVTATVVNNTTAIGVSALGSASLTVSNLTAVGFEAGKAVTSGGYSVYIGTYAGVGTTTGSRNTFVGYAAGFNNILGQGSTYVGEMSGILSIGDTNTAIGEFSGSPTVGTNDGNNNVSVGPFTLRNFTGTSNRNITIGSHAIGDNPNIAASQSDNIAIGYYALSKLQSSPNLAIGQYSGNILTLGINNVLIGNSSGILLTTGSSNTTLGIDTLSASSSGSSYNTAIGEKASAYVSGNYNTALGYKAGYNSTSGSSNVFIGSNAGPSIATTESNKLYINNAAGTPLIGGDFSTSNVYINGTLNSTSSIISGLTPTRIPYVGVGGLLVDSANLTFDGNRVSLATTGVTGGLLIGGDAPWYRTATTTLGGAVKISITPTATNATLAGFSSSVVSTVTSNGSYGGNTIYGGVSNIISAGVNNSGTVTIFTGTNLRAGNAGGNDSGTLTALTGYSLIAGHNNTDLYANPHTGSVYGANFTPYIKRGLITNYYGLLLATPTGISTPSTWVPGTAYAINTIVAPTVSTGYYYIAQNAGTSGGSEPSPWSTTENGTTIDNGIVWFTLIIPSITTEYGVYQQSVTALNCFLGAMSVGSSTVTSRFSVAGNTFSTSWGGFGKRFRLATGTYTDTSGSGTVTSIVSDSIAAVTIAASNVVTYTNAATLYIDKAPIAGTNVTLTYPWTLWIGGGNSRFDGSMLLGTTSRSLSPYSQLDAVSTTGGYLTVTRNDTSVTAGDVIGGIQARTIDTRTTTNPIAASIEFRARNTITADINAGDIFFRSTSDSVAAALTDRYFLGDKGFINLNSTPISVNTGTFAFNPKFLFFDGNVDYINWVAGQITELTSVANFSFSAWLYPLSYATTSKYILYSQVDISNRIVFFYDRSSDILRIEIDNGSTPNYGYITNFSTLYPINKWYHLVVTYDGSGAANADKLKVYLNGTLQSLSFLGTIPTTTPDLASVAFLLSLTNTSAWNGYLRRVAIYSSTIDQTAVTSLFQGTNVTTNQVHYWMVNNGYSTTITDTGSNVQNGTVIGATWIDSNQIGIGTGFGVAALNFGVSTASDQGIGWANEMFTYRSAVNTLTHTGNFIIGGDLTLSASDIITDTITGTKIGTATTQKLGFFNATPIVQPTALTAQLTSITHTAPGTPDYAIQDLTAVGGYGFVTKDEGNTVLSVILNLQTRVAELETRLKNLGLTA